MIDLFSRGKQSSGLFGSDSKKAYPALILDKTVVFPSEKVPLIVENEIMIKAVNFAAENNSPLVLIFQKDSQKGKIGVLSNVVSQGYIASNLLGVVMEGLKRVEVEDGFEKDGIKMVEVTELEKDEEEDTTGPKEKPTELEALSRSAFDQFTKLIQMHGAVPQAIIEESQKEYIPPAKVADLISSALRLDFPEKLELLQEMDVKKRLQVLNNKLAKELSIVQAERKIQESLEHDVEKEQREFFLRERLKAIEKELGIFETQKEFEDLEKKLLQAGLPEEAKKRVLGELNRLKRMPEMSAEAPYLRTYLEWVSNLPWGKKDETKVDLKRAKEVLDRDHYGLEKVKERILEYLAIQQLTKGAGRGNILVFVGPPGTGKTSVGQSIARALGRKFVRISLGGIRDEAEIRGHRRTYVGALPGRIIQGIRTAGSKNPVFMMDEIDKVGRDFIAGDPQAALLEVLDPAQNNSFADHYIEIPFDLSDVFFITTANILDPIPPALRDRMEVIEFSGYTEDEKFHIAKLFLLPRVFSESGLDKGKLMIEDRAIRKIITRYTREAGVRELERKLSEAARKVARQVAEGRIKKPLTITEDLVTDYLGPEEYEVTLAQQEDEVGVATGLAWTEAGGDIIFIEARLTPGKGNLTLTGSLGQVMQESAKAALSYIRSRATQLKFDPDFYYKSDIHIHVPSGAIPKDGPSAGVAIAVALASMLSSRKVKKDAALTGEITINGKVLKVGGIKEKVLAAHRAGVKTIILPKGNEKNLIDVPEEIKKELKFKFMEHADEILDYILIPKEKTAKKYHPKTHDGQGFLAGQQL